MLEPSRPVLPQGTRPLAALPRALPGQEGLEGDAHRKVGTAGAYGLQDASLAQLLCHMSHIKEAWDLWPETEWMRGAVKGLWPRCEGRS